MQEFRVKIGKMTCVNCSNAIERACKKIQGVSDASVSYVNSSGVFLLEDEARSQDVVKKIQNLGFEILENEQNLEEYRKKELIALRKNLLLSIVLSALIMYFEMFDTSFLSQNMQMLLSFFAIFYCGRTFFSHAIKGLKNWNLDMNTLIALGCISAFAYSFCIYLNLFENEKHLYFSGAAMIISFVLLGKFLETNAKFKALNYQKRLNEIDIKKAKILNETGEFSEIPSAFVKNGDIIVVSEGESVAVDGVVIQGKAEIDTSFLSGEFLPSSVRVDDEIKAGSILLNGNLHIKASKKAMDSTLEQIKDLVFKAGNIKTPLENSVDRISRYFVITIIAFALAVFIFWSFKAGTSEAFLHACAVLLISCPCALGLATPIALITAQGAAMKNFILIKNPVALENLNKIKTAFFDKTGTLTQNNLELFRHNLNTKDFQMLALIESSSSHPIAKAIFKASKIKAQILKGSSEIFIGKGVKYTEENEEYLLGNLKFMQESGVKNLEKADEFLQGLKEEVLICVYFSKNGECLGVLTLKNTLKEGAKELIEDFKKQKIQSIILSGDNEKSVQGVANLLGIADFKAGLLPEEKLQIIKEHKQNSLFVGDGINDAAALNLASASMSFKEGSDLAKNAGDFILMKDDLRLISWCFKLANKTKNIIKINLFWAFFYNILCIPVAAGFVPFITLSPHLAALAMCFSSLCVVLNSLRLRKV
ncbi:cation-translocating P-type ATPase [Campylobacter coli]|nr:cation-translocating P-type ATPase [Campylobacter coli]EAJ7021576.1 cation-translocating P-type ATPase [Campylobacter coli]EAW0593819.1 cation-translocating P-type ATPase [Campylobacter coli]EGS0794232.1 cation-translocating P-type ATPase [Campylobacter coli]ELJ5537899.1 cation-translocating P-type ATPase [Campylobacter coli]